MPDRAADIPTPADVPLRVFQRYGIDVETARGLIQDLTKIVDSLQRGA
ncbi:hypothetical protein [Parafrankia soli]|nr:hypothetical protein [Parafrankia soli]